MRQGPGERGQGVLEGEGELWVVDVLQACSGPRQPANMDILK